MKPTANKPMPFWLPVIIVLITSIISYVLGGCFVLMSLDEVCPVRYATTDQP